MQPFEAHIRARAIALADELADGVERGRPREWLEETLSAALREVARSERDRCAEVAEKRAGMWEAMAARPAGSWPADALAEARERRKEALVLADELRGDAPTAYLR
jgi:hypothetical protein